MSYTWKTSYKETVVPYQKRLTEKKLSYKKGNSGIRRNWKVRINTKSLDFIE